MRNLNDQQLEAAEFKNGIAAVVAIPGSGKTTVMTSRIANLVRKHGVAPDHILGLTFTRNAAAAMRDRLATVLSDELASRVNLSTIHSFCLSLLREEGKTFEILTGKEQLIFLRKIIQKLRIRDISPGTALREISLAKNNLLPADEFVDLFYGDQTLEKIGKIYQSYDLEKSKKMYLDFDDFLTETYNLLSADRKLRQKYQDYYQHLLVDEVQDTTPSHIEVLKLLVGKQVEKGKGSFWVCGDDWQAIFSWMGASVSNILNFQKVFPNSKLFILNQNYRSSPQILQACQNLIQHNTRKIEKHLLTENPDGEDVLLIEATSNEDEALQLVNEITDLTTRRGYQLKDIGILYRANFQSRTIEEAFAEHEIPYHIENGSSFYQRFEIKIMLDYLRLINDPDCDEGDEALRAIINFPNRYIGRAFMHDLEDHALAKKKHLYQALRTMKIEVPYLKKNVKDFIKMMDPLVKKAEEFEPAELIDMLRAALDYDRFITDDDIPSPDDSRIANVDELRLASTRYDGIESFLHYTETFRDESANDKEGVSLMTIHKSKGLEFKVVFVIGLVEGTLPTKKGDIEEERRIAFVGISRAMELLYLSHYQTLGGRAVQRSIFIDEILSEENPA